MSGTSPTDSQLAIGELLGSVKYLIKQSDQHRADLKELKDDIKKEIATVRGDTEALDNRVAALEKFTSKISGVLAVGLLVGTPAVVVLVETVLK